MGLGGDLMAAMLDGGSAVSVLDFITTAVALLDDGWTVFGLDAGRRIVGLLDFGSTMVTPVERPSLA